jgi:hypothetical protein
MRPLSWRRQDWRARGEEFGDDDGASGSPSAQVPRRRLPYPSTGAGDARSFNRLLRSDLARLDAVKQRLDPLTRQPQHRGGDYYEPAAERLGG